VKISEVMVDPAFLDGTLWAQSVLHRWRGMGITLYDGIPTIVPFMIPSKSRWFPRPDELSGDWFLRDPQVILDQRVPGCGWYE
jgi:hypothetical protein